MISSKRPKVRDVQPPRCFTRLLQNASKKAWDARTSLSCTLMVQTPSPGPNGARCRQAVRQGKDGKEPEEASCGGQLPHCGRNGFVEWFTPHEI